MPTPDDWAWPKLIESLQRDIELLREEHRRMRDETVAAREVHRRELDALIDQLRGLRNDIAPIVKDREDNAKLARETRWSWIERAGWVVMGGIALAVWRWFENHFGN